jgi:hypothetical protein
MNEDCDMDYLTDLKMPLRLRIMAWRVAHGKDPDEIKGIGDLWLYRVDRDRGKIDAAQTAFFDELRRRHAAGLLDDEFPRPGRSEAGEER